MDPTTVQIMSSDNGGNFSAFNQFDTGANTGTPISGGAPTYQPNIPPVQQQMPPYQQQQMGQQTQMSSQQQAAQQQAIQQQMLRQQMMQQQAAAQQQRGQQYPQNDHKLDYLVDDIDRTLDNDSDKDDYILAKNTNYNKKPPASILKQKEGYLSKVPFALKEILLIVIIYLILSIGYVKDSFGSYIKYINKDETGSVPFVGLIIYGIILAVLFVLIRSFIVKPYL